MSLDLTILKKVREAENGWGRNKIGLGEKGDRKTAGSQGDLKFKQYN